MSKVAWVTGGGSGIGASTAKVLAEHGYRVAISGRSEEKLQQVISTVSGNGKSATVMSVPLDVTDRAAVVLAHQKIVDAWGPVTLLINAAGVNVPRRSMAEMVPEEWDQLLQINATGAFNCLYQVVPGMRRVGDGLIINISSTAGLRASPLGGIAYNASKFAMSALGIGVAEEERVNGIRVTNIHPGEVDTPIMKNRPKPVSSEHRATMLQAEDVAAAVLFVCQLPPRAHVWELVLKPTAQSFV